MEVGDSCGEADAAADAPPGCCGRWCDKCAPPWCDEGPRGSGTAPPPPDSTELAFETMAKEVLLSLLKKELCNANTAAAVPLMMGALVSLR